MTEPDSSEETPQTAEAVETEEAVETHDSTEENEEQATRRRRDKKKAKRSKNKDGEEDSDHESSDEKKAKRVRAGDQNPVWFRPVMFGFMLLGLVWIIVFYITQGKYPLPTFGSWNILIGFGIAFVGFLMTTRWR